MLKRSSTIERMVFTCVLAVLVFGCEGERPRGSSEPSSPPTTSPPATNPDAGEPEKMDGNGNGGPTTDAGADIPPTRVPEGWSSGPALPVARTLHTATPMGDGTILIVGGSDARDAPLASATVFDPSTSTWMSTGTMRTARESHTATELADGRVLVVGGNPWSPLSSAEIYDPLARSWTSAGSLADARAFHTATLLEDGRVLIAGIGREIGDTRTRACPASSGSVRVQGPESERQAEVYDPATNAWSPAGVMIQERRGHTAVRLRDGRVLVAGGFGGCNTLASAELYDPSAASWSSAAPMATARQNHTATLLESGGTLVVGGGGDGLYAHGTAELYDPLTDDWESTAEIGTLASQLRRSEDGH